jgi:hypothetical protein
MLPVVWRVNKKASDVPIQHVQLDPRGESDGLHLGDIYRDVELLEWTKESEDHRTIRSSTLVFPLAMVMGQECDLLTDSALRANTRPAGRERPPKANGFMWTTLVLPLYNASQFFDRRDSCLSGIFEDVYLGTTAEPTSASLEMNHPSSDSLVKANQDARYHFICFPSPGELPDCVIDFRHYFALRTSYLMDHRAEQCLATLSTPYREQVLQRFSFYISRIGLPD